MTANVVVYSIWHEFSVQFTNPNLRKYIKKKPVDIFVECAKNGKTGFVTLKMGRGTKKAMLSGGWTKAVSEFKLKKGRIYIFDFLPSKRYVLELMVSPL